MRKKLDHKLRAISLRFE